MMRCVPVFRARCAAANGLGRPGKAPASVRVGTRWIGPSAASFASHGTPLKDRLPKAKLTEGERAVKSSRLWEEDWSQPCHRQPRVAAKRATSKSGGPAL